MLLELDKVKKLERYKYFYFLSKPTPFKQHFRNVDIDTIQVHTMSKCEDDDIVGFCGSFRWMNSIIESLDLDTYNEDMIVYGYSWFESDLVGLGLDILVGEDWQ